jgi:hypothetical protein
LHPLPRNRRGHGQGARQNLRDQRLDSRRHEGHARRPRGPRERLAESLDEVFKKPISTPSTTSTPSKPSCSASAAKATPSARTSFISATQSQEAALPRRRPLSSDRRHRGQDFVRAAIRAGNPAARQPRRPLGQRPRGDPQRRPAGHRAGNGARRFLAARTSGWIISTPASTASRRGPSARATCSARCSSQLRAEQGALVLLPVRRGVGLRRIDLGADDPLPRRRARPGHGLRPLFGGGNHRAENPEGRIRRVVPIQCGNCFLRWRAGVALRHRAGRHGRHVQGKGTAGSGKEKIRGGIQLQQRDAGCPVLRLDERRARLRPGRRSHD